MTSDIDARTYRQLQLLIGKLQNNHAYMAWIIKMYQKQEKLTLHKTIDFLSASEDSVTKLALCKRPDSDSKEFINQVEQISEYTKIDMVLLTQMIRQVESVIALSNNVGVNSDLISNATKLNFAAARDRNEENSTLENTSDDEDKNDVANG